MENIKFGNLIQTKLLCYARPDENEENGFRLMLVEPSQTFWMNESDVCIATVPVEYRPPENMSHEDLVKKAIETMRDRQKQILARAQREVTRLDEKISKLLMLTHQPEKPANYEPEIIKAEEINDIAF